MAENSTPAPTDGEVGAAEATVKPERLTVHVLWMTAGLGCDGESVAMTAATNPSIEDLLAKADEALYRVKSEGRGRYLFHDGSSSMALFG